VHSGISVFVPLPLLFFVMPPHSYTASPPIIPVSPYCANEGTGVMFCWVEALGCTKCGGNILVLCHVI